jgi:hypothetical protein
MDWGEVVKFIGTYAILLAVTGLVARSTFVYFLSKDIDKYKMELRAEQDKELMRLRARLEKASVNGTSRSSRLQEKQAEAVARLYKLLLDAERSYETMSANGKSPDKTVNERIKKSEKTLWDYVEKNRLLLDPKLCGRLERHYVKLLDTGINYSLPVGNEARLNGSLKETRLSFAKDIPKLRSQIESEFRLLLGSMNSFED